jgi:hypothetical protein
MIDAALQAGDIFIWKNYPLFMHEFKSQRWLLYLGHQSLDAMVYQITTTTQFRHYEPGGNRLHHNFFKIPAGIGGLVMDSILDLTAFFERIPEALLNKYNEDIERKGAFNQDYVNKLVNHLKKDRHILPMFKKDIYGYLRAAGFTVNV